MKKTISIILVIIIIALFIIPGVLYVRKKHNDNLWLVIEKEVVEAADKCINAEVCKEDKITIKTLIDNGYLEKVYDPITKEAINNASYIENEKLVIVKWLLFIFRNNTTKYTW